mmetsp:Transcript_2258/g.4318  ORF Transcript_2258/g.4318 Transcript_2258/m.4318 type:complete len:245 (-) Transcript_2258:1230-1964(-)
MVFVYALQNFPAVARSTDSLSTVLSSIWVSIAPQLPKCSLTWLSSKPSFRSSTITACMLGNLETAYIISSKQFDTAALYSSTVGFNSNVMLSSAFFSGIDPTSLRMSARPCLWLSHWVRRPRKPPADPKLARELVFNSIAGTVSSSSSEEDSTPSASSSEDNSPLNALSLIHSEAHPVASVVASSQVVVSASVVSALRLVIIVTSTLKTGDRVLEKARRNATRDVERITLSDSNSIRLTKRRKR